MAGVWVDNATPWLERVKDQKNELQPRFAFVKALLDQIDVTFEEVATSRLPVCAADLSEGAALVKVTADIHLLSDDEQEFKVDTEYLFGDKTIMDAPVPSVSAAVSYELRMWIVFNPFSSAVSNMKINLKTSAFKYKRIDFTYHN